MYYKKQIHFVISNILGVDEIYYINGNYLVLNKNDNKSFLPIEKELIIEYYAREHNIRACDSELILNQIEGKYIKWKINAQNRNIFVIKLFSKVLKLFLLRKRTQKL